MVLLKHLQYLYPRIQVFCAIHSNIRRIVSGDGALFIFSFMKITLLTFYLFFLLFSCRPEKEPEQTVSAALGEYFDGEFSADEPGGAVLVVMNDSIIFSKGYGLASLQTREVITPATLFNIGSISKTFVANGILMLQAQGKLSVEDSLQKYFAGFRNTTIAQKVKIKHLLTHTSGLPDLRNVSGDSIFYLTAKDAENWYPIMQTDSLEFEPGSQFNYSNPAFNGLALIIEKVTGMRWQQFIIDSIFKPAGMTSSTITDGPHPDKDVSHGYVRNHSEWIEDDYGEEPTFPAAGNGGVWSSVEELIKYEKAIQQSLFLPSDVVDDSRTIKHFENWIGTRAFGATWSWLKPEGKSESLTPMVGWSWFIGATSDGSKIVSHTGSQGGFLCNYVSIPEKQIAFIILCNTPKDIYAYSDKIISLLNL